MLLKAATSRSQTWLLALGPVLGLGLVLATIVAVDPVGRLGTSVAVESVAVERTVLEPDRIVLHVRNDGAEPVTIAQVTVNDAFRAHSTVPRTLDRLGAAKVTIPYPWEEAIPLHVSLLTTTGTRISHEIPSPSLSPRLDAQSLADYALLGLLIGVIPVTVGLLWLPALRRGSPAVIAFFLAFTVGLLALLLAETVAEGLELGREAPSRLNGGGLFALGFFGVVAIMAWVESALRRRPTPGPGRGPGPAAPLTGLGLAYLVAVGIGLHNLGEGLAVGAAVAVGELALGTSLVVGFAAHNTTEGLAIAAPLADRQRRFSLGHLGALALVAGGPTVLGTWAGAFVATAAWSALAFGVAAGAIAQVAWSVGRSVIRGHGVGAISAFGFVAGLVVMYLTSLLAAA